MNCGIGQQPGLQHLRLRHAVLRADGTQVRIVLHGQQRDLRHRQGRCDVDAVVVQAVESCPPGAAVPATADRPARRMLPARGRAAAEDHQTEKHATGESVHAARHGGCAPCRRLAGTFAIDKLTAAALPLWHNRHEESPVRILLIEDDPETADYVVAGLQSEAHELEVASDGRTGLLRAASETWDLLIVDRMLPGLDGLAVVRTLRASEIATPVLFLTTMGGIDDRVTGLNAGGDDYLIKPFAFAELVARVAALGRRPQRTAPETVLRVADLEMDLLTRVVRRGGEEVALQPREYELLEYLMKHAGQVVTRTMLLEKVWGFHFDPRTSLVESHISRLRGKIDRGRPELIDTVRGSGYCLRAPA